MRTTSILLAALVAATPAVCRESTDVRSVATGMNTFAFDLYGTLRAKDGNLFLSPYSLSTALAMTWAGARGETEKEMAAALRFPLGQESLHPAYGALIDELNAAGRSGDFALAVANRLWGQAGYKILPEFRKTVKASYGAELVPADFRNDSEGVRKEINGWVEQQTKNKIRDLIGPNVLGSDTRMVLVNAIYFKGLWKDAFDERVTAPTPFHREGAAPVDAQMMRRVDHYRYAEDADVQVLELPYKGEGLSMIVLLPRAADGRKALEDRLSAGKVQSWMDAMQSKKVDVRLPRFKMTSQFSLAEQLGALGMKSAFTGDADFSGMTGNRDLFISAVIHKAFVDVNEKGTEAAAATAVVMELTAARPEPPSVEFKADHPFVFLIRDNASGAILFLGRMMDPAE